MKPIGYQVVDSNGDMPEGMWSFEIYPLDACLRMAQTDKQRWRLLPIYEGDIEEPTMCNGSEYVILGNPELVHAFSKASDKDAFLKKYGFIEKTAVARKRKSR
jgi:hypothetical protein